MKQKKKLVKLGFLIKIIFLIKQKLNFLKTHNCLIKILKVINLQQKKETLGAYIL